MIHIAKKWLGYLEHNNNDLLGVYTGNSGKGGCTIFSTIIRQHYRMRNFSGVPWCVVFVFAVCLEAYGKERAKELLGKPVPGVLTLVRRMQRRKLIRDTSYIPQTNDLIFLHNGNGEIGHCGIVDGVEGDVVITIEGNTVDPSGYFPKDDGGAVAMRRRELTDPSIVSYAQIHDL